MRSRGAARALTVRCLRKVTREVKKKGGDEAGKDWLENATPQTGHLNDRTTSTPGAHSFEKIAWFHTEVCLGPPRLPKVFASLSLSQKKKKEKRRLIFSQHVLERQAAIDARETELTFHAPM